MGWHIMLQFPMRPLSDHGRWSWLGLISCIPHSHTQPCTGPHSRSFGMVFAQIPKRNKRAQLANCCFSICPLVELILQLNLDILTLDMAINNHPGYHNDLHRTVPLIIDNDNYWGLHVAARHDGFESAMGLCSIEAPTGMLRTFI